VAAHVSENGSSRYARERRKGCGSPRDARR
jgi:hypothetical protein